VACGGASHRSCCLPIEAENFDFNEPAQGRIHAIGNGVARLNKKR